MVTLYISFFQHGGAPPRPRPPNQLPDNNRIHIHDSTPPISSPPGIKTPARPPPPIPRVSTNGATGFSIPPRDKFLPMETSVSDDITDDEEPVPKCELIHY